MNKFLAFGLFSILMLAVTLTASAATPAKCLPGCDCDNVLPAEKNHTDALTVRDKAVTMQIKKQPDNSIGMTCFDRSLGLTARLGQIFSDTYPPADFAAASTKVFGTLYDGGSSSGHLLGDGLEKVISNMMQEHANDFSDSLSSWLGATALTYLNGFMAPFVQGITSAIGTLVSSINTAISAIDSAMGTLMTVLDTLGTVLPSIIPTVVNAIQGYWNTIKGALADAVKLVQDAIRTVVQTITDFIMNLAENVLGGTADDKNVGECSRIQRLWNPGIQAPVGDFRSVTGGGLEQGTPYQTFSDLLNKVGPGMGADMFHEINNATNSTILSTALGDITGSGVLAGPGNMPSWPTVPAFVVNETVGALRAGM